MAWPTSRRLKINLHSPLGIPFVCLHEFAHLVAEQRAPDRGHWHRAIFRRALLDVIHAAGLAAADYPWHREYASLARWAERRGLAAGPTCVGTPRRVFPRALILPTTAE
jgi:hypothetical protein